MGTFDQLLNQSNIIGLDTSIFIYQIEANPRYHHLTTEILGAVESGRCKAVTSVLTLLEITTLPWQLGNAEAARKYEALLANFPNLEFVDIDRSVARQAARLRAEYRLRTPDALQVAAAISREAQVFFSNDRRLEKISPAIKTIIIEDYLNP